MLPAQPNQSLIDGLRCLEMIAGHPEHIGVRDLARRLGMNATRVNRLLKTLAHMGYLLQDTRRKYGPGPGIHALSARSLLSAGLVRRAAPALDELRDGGLTVALGILWGAHVCYVIYAEGDMDMAESIGRITLTPAPRSSIGMMVLARRSDEAIDAFVREHRDTIAPGEIETFRRQLGAFRRQGFARIDAPDDPVNRTSLAVTLEDPPHAAIAVAGHIKPPRISRLVERLRQTAQTICHGDTDPEPIKGIERSVL